MLSLLVLQLAFSWCDKRNLMEGVSVINSAKLSDIAIYWVKLVGSYCDF